MQSESAVRRAAKKIGYRVEKSRDRHEHVNNHGQFRLVENHSNMAMVGVKYDASLEAIADYLSKQTEEVRQELAESRRVNICIANMTSTFYESVRTANIDVFWQEFDELSEDLRAKVLDAVRGEMANVRKCLAMFEEPRTYYRLKPHVVREYEETLRRIKQEHPNATITEIDAFLMQEQAAKS